VDTKLGLVYIPTGNPADSYYGGDRPGDNLYSASIIALDALSGKLRWARQIVHHDLWDYDMSAPPALVEVKRNGKTIPALAQITKESLLFILDRRTGEPVFGIEERPVPKGDVPGEWYSPTEPFPLKPAPLSPLSLNSDELSKRSPEAEKFCRDWFSTLHNNGPFTPYGTTPTLLIPGSQGGGNWGGVSFDPKLGLIFANTNNIAAVGRMVPRTDGVLPYRNDGGSTRFIDQQGYPCTAPPWAQLAAINANTGDIVWQSVLGSYDELEAQGLKNTGAIAMGGPIVTAGNLVFIAATTDSKFRAFESRNGKELWVTKLDAGGTTVPMTYMGSNGKQYVVVAAGGTNRWGMIAGTAGHNADTLIAFALSDKPKNGPSISGSQPATAPSPQTLAAPRPAAVAVSPAQAASYAADAAASLPDGDGKATVVASCTKCHGTSVFTSIRMNRLGWEDEVKLMRDKGAVGTDEDFKKITDYLTRTFPRQ
jgi:quinoprotein glucose dehydrogenase